MSILAILEMNKYKVTYYSRCILPVELLTAILLNYVLVSHIITKIITKNLLKYYQFFRDS